jgi:selenium-dependent molybdenum hydroxylase system YqeB family protein
MNPFVIVRGGGDIASGTIYKLYQSGFQVLITEIEHPSAIRRNVAFSESVYNGTQTIEGCTCYRAADIREAEQFLQEGKLTLMVDEDMSCLSSFKPMAVVDGILAKRNLGTHRGMAPITIALGPGFTAGEDVDAVIETKRGHQLGRIIYEGQAIANTGTPGNIAGFSKERVMHSPAEGRIRNVKKITDIVSKDEVLAWIETDSGDVPVYAKMDGLLRGLIRDGYPVTKGFKVADIDPRLTELDNCFIISDKARCIAGGVLEALLHLSRNLSRNERH